MKPQSSTQGLGNCCFIAPRHQSSFLWKIILLPKKRTSLLLVYLLMHQESYPFLTKAIYSERKRKRLRRRDRDRQRQLTSQYSGTYQSHLEWLVKNTEAQARWIRVRHGLSPTSRSLKFENHCHSIKQQRGEYIRPHQDLSSLVITPHQLQLINSTNMQYI